MGFSRQGYRSGLPCPPPGDLPDPGIFLTQGSNSNVVHCRRILYCLRHQGSPVNLVYIIGEGNGNPLQYSCLENPMKRGTWRATVHRVTKSRTRLKRFSMYACIYQHLLASQSSPDPVIIPSRKSRREGGRQVPLALERGVLGDSGTARPPEQHWRR